MRSRIIRLCDPGQNTMRCAMFTYNYIWLDPDKRTTGKMLINLKKRKEIDGSWPRVRSRLQPKPAPDIEGPFRPIKYYFPVRLLRHMAS